MVSLIVHGSRGSSPASSAQMQKYGGHTSCFEILTGSYQIFLDAGTGFQSAVIREDREVIILFSHFHHDHIQGLLHNPYIFNNNQRITLATGLTSEKYLKKNLKKYFSPPYFPPNIFTTLSQLSFQDFTGLKCHVEPELVIDCMLMNHPGGAVGYSVKSCGAKITSFLDNEYDAKQERELSKFATSSDVVIWDGMFTDSEITQHAGWGHSSIEQAVRFSKKEDIKRVLICHHAPNRTDDEIDALQKQICSRKISFGADKMQITWEAS